MKKTAVLSGLMALTLLLGGCSAQQAGGETPTTPPAAAATVDPAEKTTGVGFYFDTVVTITLYGADDALMEDIWAACKRYENMLSKTVEGSDVSRINNAHGQTVTVDAETWNVLSEAKKLNRLTGGAFAITIAPLTAQWDFTGGTNRMPTDEERIAALPLVDDEQLTLGENNTVTLPAGMQIDLGGIAKGYIADQVAALVRGRCSGAMLNFGGNVYAVGTKPDGSAYRVGVQDPDEPNSSIPTGLMSVTNSSSPIGVVSVIDRSVVTSGIYERGFTIDGVRYHHILSPWTGLPSDSDLASLSIYLDGVYHIFSPTKLKNALLKASAERAFHPIKEYLEALPEWDGTKRLESLLIDYLGAEDNSYVRAVTRKTLTAAVARVFEPGVKFDTVLVLSGPQGIGKSMIFAKLGSIWFSDSLTISDMRDKTGAEKLQGFWIMEIGEMNGIKKVEVETVIHQRVAFHVLFP